MNYSFASILLCSHLLFVLILNGQQTTAIQTSHTPATDSQKKWTKLSTETYAGKQDDIYFENERQGWYVNGYGEINRV